MPRFSISELETVLGTAGVGVWAWEPATDTVRWSDAFGEVMGLPPGTNDGQRSDMWARMLPEDRPRVEQVLQECLESKARQCGTEFRVRLLTGETRTISATGTFEYDEGGTPISGLGTATDVSDTRHSQTLNRLYNELASDYVYVVDVKRPTLAPSVVAGSFERTTGYTPQEVEERGGWQNVMHPDDATRAFALLDQLRDGRPLINEYRILDKSGATRWLRDRIFPTVSADGTLVELTGAVQDITERKVLEEQLMQAQKLEALARLAGSVAHDFNNLLTVLVSVGPELESDATSDRGRAALEDLEEVTSRASDLTTSLLAFGRKSVGPAVPVSTKELLDGVRPILSRALGERTRLRIDNGVPDATIVIDRGQVDMALLNLVVNARDAMPRGGEVRVAVRVHAGDDPPPDRPPELARGDCVCIDVADTGVGIEPTNLPRIFEPFFTTKASTKGTGLGLSSVHGVMHQHSGAVSVESKPEQGARFTLWFPAATPGTPNAGKDRSRVSVGGREKILVVEDEPMVRRLLVRILGDLGYEVSAVASAEEALERTDGIDLLISDVRLPGMPGTELAVRLADGGHPAKILLISGYVEDEKQRSVIDSNRFSFLPKPLSPRGLSLRVRELLEPTD